MTRARDLAAFVSNADGDIKFDTDTLFIDSSANSVGIGTSTPTAYGNGQTTLVVEDSSNPAIAISDTGQTRDWFLVALGDGLGIRYADGGGSGSASNVTESTFFKNDGSVGIGTSSPNGNLDITGSGNTDVYINTGNNSGDNSRIFFGDSADIDVGSLSYDHGTNSMVFGVNAGSRMSITSDGILTANNHQIDILDGAGDVSMRLNNLSSGSNSGRISIDPDNSAAGSTLAIHIDGTEEARFDSDGLKFNGDSAAANALDDYEEGTFTPTVEGSSAAGTVTYTTQDGNYTKIGRMVTVMVNITINTISGMSGTVRFKGLPFTFSSGTNSGARGVISMSGVNYDPATYNLVAAYPSGGSQAVQVLGTRDSQTWVVFTTSHFTIGAGDGIAFQVTYFAD